MKILYHMNNVRFIVQNGNKHYIVSLPKKEAIEVDNAESILRQGYWQAAKDIDDKIKEACASLIRSI